VQRLNTSYESVKDEQIRPGVEECAEGTGPIAIHG